MRRFVTGLALFVVLSAAGAVALRHGARSAEGADLLQQVSRPPRLDPDYVGVTIPPNIAPMNFFIQEEGSSFQVTASSGSGEVRIRVTSSDGKIRFPNNAWRELLEENIGSPISFTVVASMGDGGPDREYEPFQMTVSPDPIDPWLVYRLIYPGYYSWSEMRIMQRSVEDFREEPIIDNQTLENNCANCHSFNENDPEEFLIHIRGSRGGTYFIDGNELTRTDPTIEGLPGGATYPSWHPDGRYVAFSSNQVRQSFYSLPGKVVEVYDLASSLILYDREANETVSVTGDEDDLASRLYTFPSWSPQGDHLYFSRAPLVIDSLNPQLEQIQNTHYDIARKAFDPDSRRFGETEVVYDASEMGGSASFPRISPDGRLLVFTLADYGTFPIWHREADLYLLDLKTGEPAGEPESMEINSDETESYHAWSSNGRWLVFSSRRRDGRTTRPYFAHIDPEGNQGKEFILPQEDPWVYREMLESFNVPELVTGRVGLDSRDFVGASRQGTLKARPGNPPDAQPQPSTGDRTAPREPGGLPHDR